MKSMSSRRPRAVASAVSWIVFLGLAACSDGDSPALSLDAGATSVQDPREVGGGRVTATLNDPDGNVIGLLQDA